MSKPEVTITQWSVNYGRLTGRVQDHPRFDPDTFVHTSSIIKRPLNLVDGSKVETRNTVYILKGPKA